MSTAILQAQSSRANGAVCRYWALGSVLAAADTIGINVAADTFLQTAPAGGQSLQEALLALCVLIGADVDYSATFSENQDADMCLRVDGVGAVQDFTISTPVFVVA